MMRYYSLFLFSVLFIASSCGEEKPAQEPEPVVVQPEPQVDSVQLQVEAYERQLSEAEEDISKSIRQLNRLSTQLQDSINGTQVPPQIQEETINNYRNKLHEVKQVQAALLQWQQRDAQPADTLTTQQRKEFLENQLQSLERLMTETRVVRQEAQQAMQESDREEY